MTADSSDNTTTLICRWLLAIALCTVLVIGVRWRHMERRALAGETPGATPVQQLLDIDVGGDLLVYGSSLSSSPGFGAPSATAFERSRPYAQAVEGPDGALRLAAMDAFSGNTERATTRLEALTHDEQAAALAAGLRAEPGSPALSEALDVASALQPLWMRRAYRVALAKHAGDQDLLAREQGLIALEAGPRLTRIFALAGLMTFLLVMGVPALFAALIYGVYRAAVRAGAPVGRDPASLRPPAQAHAGAEADTPGPRPWCLIDAVEIVLTFFSAQVMIVTLLGVLSPELGPTLLTAVAYVGPAACAAAVARWRVGPGFVRLLGYSGSPAWRSWLVAWWAALALPWPMMALLWAEWAVMGRPPMSENPVIAVVAGSRGWGERALVIALLTVVAPVVEEGLFRGALYAPVRRYAGPVWAIALTSLVFGAVHVDLAVLPQLALIGVACAILREATGSLKASIMLHGIWNAGMVGVMLLLAS